MKTPISHHYIITTVFIICTMLYLTICLPAYCQNDALLYFQQVGDINMIPTCMLQDRDGFIWIGTRGGLIKYNGVTFKFIKSGSGSISGNHIVSMLEDSDGLIWLGINGIGVNKLDKSTGEITVYAYGDNNSDGLVGTPSQYLLQSLIEDDLGRIWIGSLNGLSCFDKIDNTFKNYLYDDYDTNSLLYNKVFSIFKDSKGYIWIGYEISEKNRTGNLDFSRLNPETGEFKHYDIIDNSYAEFFIRAITQDSQGNLWIAFWNTVDSIVTHHLLKFDPATSNMEEYFKRHADSTAIYSQNIYQLEVFPDYTEYLFINNDDYDNPTTIQINLNTEKHIFYNKDTANTYGEQNPGFRYMLQDKSGVLWGIDHYGKLFKHEPLFARFQVLKNNPVDARSIPSHKVIRMVEDRDSSHIVWMGTLDRGLIKWNRKQRTFFQYPSIPGDRKTLTSNYIIGLADNGTGKIIIGSLSQKGKLSVLDKSKNTIVKHFDLAGINYILPDAKDADKIWCTGVYFGLTLVELDMEKVITFSHISAQSTSISSDLSYWVIQDLDNDNHLWVATSRGLNRFNKNTNKFKSFLHDPDDAASIPDMKINSIKDNGDGTLWVCTAGGLAHFDKQSGKSQVYNKQTGFPTDFVYTVQMHDNTIWIQSDIGIIKFNKQEPENTRVYGDKYGVTPFIYQGSLKTHDNLIFFSGSLEGPTYFHPDDIKSNPFKPPVYLTSLKQGGIEMELQAELEKIKTIDLSWNQNFFEFEYMALNYIKPHRNQYQYKLVGFDKDWFDAGTRKYGRYSNLRGGTYVLRIRGSNNDGPWSEPDQEVALQVIVEIPFWLAWWFYTIIGCIVLAVISFFIFMRVQDEQALKRSEAKFRGLVETSSDWIWEVNAASIYTYASPQVKRILGYAPEELLGKTPFELMPPKEAKRISRILRDLVKAGKPIVSLENICLHKNGSRIILETSGVPIFDEAKKIIGYRGIDRDITERKRVSEELQKMERLKSIGTLAGGIAHDFNNIMLVLFGSISIAKDELSPQHPAFNQLEKAEQSMNRAINLTNQLLTFAKGGEPRKEKTNIGQLIKDVVHFDLSGSNIKPIFKQADNLWLAEVDKGQIQQVFSNLTINAREAMPEGGFLYVDLDNVEIEKNEIPKLKKGNYIMIKVRDQGSGIEAKYLKRIFDPYFSTKKAGSGLGLATVYSIVKKHEGHIMVDSQPGKGTSFTLILPALKKIAQPDKEKKETKPTKIKQSAKILVMDDEEIIRRLVTDMLDREGFLVASAADGKEVIKIYRQALLDKQPFSAVIMDLTIPGGMGGKQAIKEILKIDPQARVIVSSGYAEDDVMATYAKYGFKGIATKPYTKNKLLKVLKQVLENVFPEE